MKVDSQCAHCKHLDRPWKRHGLGCAAFPDELPDTLYYNKHDHRKPYPGDKGIRWEPATAEDTNWWEEE